MRRKILVVDDDPDIVEMLTYILKQSGFDIATAKDGFDALNKARSVEPDLVLLDLKLPELDGFAVCERLRNNAGTADTPVIMLTAMPGELGRLCGLECGANAYLTKPFSPKELVSKVDGLLKKRDSRK